LLRVGTSGWQYRDWRGAFYPPALAQKHWLEHYAAHFETVEVNNTFYRLPARTTFEQWAARVPTGFVVAVKASRYLTHIRRLREPEAPVALLLERAEPLGTHLGPILVQLPPDMKAEPERLDATLRAFGTRVRVAVEPRHGSWFTEEIHAVLARHNAALCLADRGSRPITPLWRTADWCYLRLHAGAARPAPCYGERALASWIDRLRDLWGDGADGYVYFNNDAKACAVRDAETFTRLATRLGLAHDVQG
jgi:uncharacterized protein YecE (DUF72 family)